MADDTCTCGPSAPYSSHEWDCPQEPGNAAERYYTALLVERDAEVAHWRGRFERMRLMYRERFNEGLSTADWHAKHCGAMTALAERDAAVLALVEKWSRIWNVNEQHSPPAELRALVSDPARVLADVKAEALREAARDMRNGLPTYDPNHDGIAAFEPSHADWLCERADRLSGGA